MVAMVAFSARAHAFKPRADPSIARFCPTAASWQLLVDCSTAHKFALVELGSVDNAKLVAVTAGGTTALEGIALYISGGVAPGTAWHLGGLLQEREDRADVELLRFVHLGKYGYRFDLGVTSPSSMSLDGVTAEPSIERRLVVAICNGSSRYCTVVVPKCERIVHGQAIVMFDGTLVITNDRVSVTGYGSASSCSSNTEESMR